MSRAGTYPDAGLALETGQRQDPAQNNRAFVFVFVFQLLFFFFFVRRSWRLEPSEPLSSAALCCLGTALRCECVGLTQAKAFEGKIDCFSLGQNSATSFYLILLFITFKGS